jgi:regulator of sigma E protease
MGIFLLIVGLALFIGLVVVHELGHFWAARRGGVEVEEFGIFFPPRLYRHKTKSGYDFTVNALPLGGFVKLKGEHDSDREKGSYGAARTRTKVQIMLAGVFMNLITALALFTVLAWLGMPRLVPNQFTVASDTHENAQTTASSQVSGPVGIFVVLKGGSMLGYQFMLMIIAVISLTLAIMNVLPIPALDGGRLFVMIISRLFKKQISQKAEEAIYGTGFAVLMLLIVVITVVDVKRFF